MHSSQLGKGHAQVGEALAVKGRVLWELSSFWTLSLSPWERRATVCHTSHFRQGPPESPVVFLASLAKLQPQRTSLLVPLSLPLRPRTPSLLSLCLECCSLWEPGSVPHACLRLLRANPGPRCVYVTQCSFDQKSLNARLQESWAGAHPRHPWCPIPLRGHLLSS